MVKLTRVVMVGAHNGMHRRQHAFKTRSKRRRGGCFGCCCVSDRSEDEFMSQAMAMTEFVLFIIVLVLFLEIGPSEMPRVCDGSLQQACLDDYTAADTAAPRLTRPASQPGGAPNGADVWPVAPSANGVESRLAGMTCGSSRVWCWRSGMKYMLYQTDDALDEDADIRDYHAFFAKHGEYSTNNTGIPSGVLHEYGAIIKYCHCMMTSNGTTLLPRHPHAWRVDTTFYCKVVTQDQWALSGFGLVLLVMLIWVRSVVDADAATASAYSHSIKVTTVTLLWLYYSGFTVSLLVPYASRDSAGQDCEYPSANILFYVFYLALLSLVCSVVFAVGGCTIMCGYLSGRKRLAGDPAKQV